MTRLAPRALVRRCALLVAAGALGAGCATSGTPARGDDSLLPGSATTSTTSTTTTTIPPSTTSTVPPKPPFRRIDDGSLGDQATRVACTLLTERQIASQFGGPVGGPTPTEPYCQWLVGSDAFLALSVQPGVSFATATQYVAPLQPVKGLGQAAEIGNNRFLYFTSGGTSYWLLWQQVGDFSSLHVPQLTALARDVLAHGFPPHRVGLPPRVPAGPPIYFAGDSTAAGPEWAFVTYHTAHPLWHTLAEYQVGSGLVVPGFFDWSRHLLAVVAARRPRLVVYMGSANDGQAMLVNGAVAVVGSAPWRRVYGEVVGGIMTSLVREGCKVLWIGEPAMQSPSLSADMAAMDQVVAAEAAHHRGVTFFNPTDVLGGPHGAYAPTLVIGGVRTPVRLDGVHLNVAGSEYLANYIARYVSGILRRLS